MAEHFFCNPFYLPAASIGWQIVKKGTKLYVCAVCVCDVCPSIDSAGVLSVCVCVCKRAWASLRCVCVCTQQGSCVCSFLCVFCLFWCMKMFVCIIMLLYSAANRWPVKQHTLGFFCVCVFSQQGFSCCSPADWSVRAGLSYHSNCYMLQSPPP